MFGLALVVRLIHLWQIGATPFATVLMGDARAYDHWAQAIAGGELIGRDVFYQAPLYAYFLGAVYAVAGHDLQVARVCQAVIGATACVLLGAAAARLFSRRAGIIAGVALGAYAPAIFFDGLIQKSVLDVFFVCLVVWLLSGLVRSDASARDAPTWFALGAALGALALTRENALLLVLVLVGWILVRRTAPARRRVTAAAILLAGVGVVIAPVAVRNSIAGQAFHLTTSQFGPNLYIGNNPQADGTYMSLRAGRGAPEYEQRDARELAEAATGQSLTPSQVSAYWTARAVAFMTERPGEWGHLLVRKVMLLWNADEAVDTESLETYAEWSPVLRVSAGIAHFGTLLPLAVLGVCATWAARERLGVYYLITLTYAASVVVFFVLARYRLPLVPLLVLFASGGIVMLPEFVRRASPRLLLASVAVATGAAVIANRPLLEPDLARAITYTNLGSALRAEGQLDAAAANHRRALAILPDYPEAHYNLANVLVEQHRVADAAVHFKVALRTLPATAGAYYAIGTSLEDQGQLAEAARYFEMAVDLDPASAAALERLGHALALQGRPAAATVHLRRAVDLEPSNATARHNLGTVLLQQDDVAAAVREFEAALAIAPESYELHNVLGVALASQGRREEAVRQFAHALELKPDFGDAQRNLELVRESGGPRRPADGSAAGPTSGDGKFVERKGAGVGES